MPDAPSGLEQKQEEIGGMDMILYHGSSERVTETEILAGKGNHFLDFGMGFYAASTYEQTENWAGIKMQRTHRGTGYVSVYDLDLASLRKTCKIKRFEKQTLSG